jgi:small GTP-binding protein
MSFKTFLGDILSDYATAKTSTVNSPATSATMAHPPLHSVTSQEHHPHSHKKHVHPNKYSNHEDAEDMGDDPGAQLAFDIEAMGLDTDNITKRPQSPPPIATKMKPGKGPKLDLVKEAEKRLEEKGRLNLVVIGHVDSGKSTLFGHLLFLLGKIQERTLRKYQKEAENIKKGSFSFAWVLDETEEERSRGVTIDIALNEFETPNRKFTLLDAPGHRDFIPNMISGATQADVALLVIDASTGGFESGFLQGGQTREHAVLAKSLGLSQLIVAINKMDSIQFSKPRFDWIIETLLPFLRQIGFRKEQVSFIPVSGFKGDNLVETSPLLEDWYTGPTLLKALDSLEIPKRDLSLPFRLPIHDLYKGRQSGGLIVDGRIEAGGIQVGDVVSVQPGQEVGTVKGISASLEGCLCKSFY